MADRYWIGGPGTWNTSGTTKWSAAAGIALPGATCSGTTLTTTTSPALIVGMTVFGSTATSLGTITGGSGNTWTVSIGGTFASQTMTAGTVGASVPTVADNVFFSAGAGTGTITMSGALACLSFDSTGASALTFTNTGTLNCAGNFTIIASTIWNTSGTITFSSTSTGRTITTNGKTLACGVTFNGVGGGWTLAGALTITGNITLTAGIFSTGGFALSAAAINISGSTTRTFNMASSAVTVSSSNGWTATTTTNLTFTNTGSTLNLPILGGVFAGGGLSYATVAKASGSNGNLIVTGANTFTNFTVANNGSNSISYVAFPAGVTQTITGTLTLSGTSATNYSLRNYITSSTKGSQATLKIAALATLRSCDFRDITVDQTGAVTTITGTSLGNLGGNNFITFTAAKTVYCNIATSSANWTATMWALTSGGVASNTNYPLAQDTAIVDNSTTSLFQIDITTGVNLPNLDMSARTNSLTLNVTADSSIYGNLVLGPGLINTGNSVISFANRDINTTITTNGRTLVNKIIIDCVARSVTLIDAFTQVQTGGFAFEVTAGTFDTAGFAFTTTSFRSIGTVTRGVTLGASAFSLTGTTNVLTLAATGLTWNYGTSITTLSDASVNAKNITLTDTGALVLGKVVIGGGSSAISDINIVGAGSNHGILELSSTRSLSYVITFSIVPTNFTVGSWLITGTLGNPVSVRSSSTGTAADISITNKTTGIDYLSISDIYCLSKTPVTFWAGPNSTNSQNNMGIAFADGSATQAYILDTVGSSTFSKPADWNDAANSIYLIGGGGGASGSIANGAIRVTGAGGGGGGFSFLSNQAISASTSYTIGAGGTGTAGSSGTSTGGLGGLTQWGATIAAAGTGGAATTTTSIGGSGGAGTYAGGNGGAGNVGTSAAAAGGAGGGGAAGPLGPGAVGGAGAQGGVGFAGGGGGNGGGSAGGAASGTASGAGGNNALSVGGGASRSTSGAGNLGVLGGGGGGAGGTGLGGSATPGADILNSFGSGGGGGGSGSVNNGSAVAGAYGGGGGGAGIGTGLTTYKGGDAQSGAIILVYTLSSGSNFFLLF